MKAIKQVLKEKRAHRVTPDEKTILHVCERILEEEFGRRGRRALMPQLVKNKKVLIKTRTAVWANALWLHRDVIVRSIQKQAGTHTITGVVIIR